LYIKEILKNREACMEMGHLTLNLYIAYVRKNLKTGLKILPKRIRICPKNMRKGGVAEPTLPPKMSYNRMKAFFLEIQALKSVILSFAEFSFAV
jgi:hypothetical protein